MTRWPSVVSSTVRITPPGSTGALSAAVDLRWCRAGASTPHVCARNSSMLLNDWVHAHHIVSVIAVVVFLSRDRADAWPYHRAAQVVMRARLADADAVHLVSRSRP